MCMYIRTCMYVDVRITLFPEVSQNAGCTGIRTISALLLTKKLDIDPLHNI